MLERINVQVEASNNGNEFLTSLSQKISPTERKFYSQEIKSIIKESQQLEGENLDLHIAGSIQRIKNSHFRGFPEEVKEGLIRDRFEFAFLDVAIRTLHDRRLSEDTRDKRLSILEKIADKFDKKSNEFTIASLFIFGLRREGEPVQEAHEGGRIVSKALPVLQIGLGAALGYFGADIAEKYAGFMPQLQMIAGVSILAALFVRGSSKDAIKYIGAKIPGLLNSGFGKFFDNLDRFVGAVEPGLAGFAGGMLVHSLIDSGHAGRGEKLGSKESTADLEKYKPVSPETVPAETHAPENPGVIPTNIEPATTKYTVLGTERGGLTDILVSFHQDPYGEAMTKFVVQNKDVLADPARRGHEAVEDLVRYLETNPGFTWRDAMNESAKAGHATSVSKLFTEALRFIRPGTIFQVPIN